MRRKTLAPALLASLAIAVFAAPTPAGDREPLDLKKLFQDGIPPAPFAEVFYAYANAVLAGAGDAGANAGGERSPLDPLDPVDESLIRLLDFLRELSSEARYTEAADRALGRLLAGEPPPPGAPSRLRLLWPRAFALDPAASERWARALLAEAAERAKDPREAGSLARAWAEAYTRTRDPVFLAALESVVSRAEEEAFPPPTAAGGVLSLAIDLDGAARRVPEPLRSRLSRAARRLDLRFLSLPHDLHARGGFVRFVQHPRGAAPAAREAAGSGSADSGTAATPLWDPSLGGETTAQVAMMCVSRYESTGRPAFRDLITLAADLYLDSLPAAGADAWPRTFGQAISLELAAFRITAQKQYERRATELAESARRDLYGASPLPRASLLAAGPDPRTGASSLALALADLHLTVRHITAVRAPPNTAER
jgi:hypothetical protein